VNLLKNDISVAQAEDLVSILKEHPTLKSLCGNRGNEAALDMSGKMTGAADAIMLVAEIIDNGAILKLDMSNNMLATKEIGEALGEMLLANTTLTELDVSKNALDHHGRQWPGADGSGFAQGICKGLSDSGALTSINVKENNIGAAQEEMIYRQLRMNKLRIALSDKTLTELAVSGIGFGAEGAKLVAEYISDNGALTSLNLSSNGLKAEGAKIVAEAIKVTSRLPI
jgi:Ran GTPase-activating protein (RanGAP) involved in mRNA processing and transport